MNTWAGFPDLGAKLAWWVGQEFKLNDGYHNVVLTIKTSSCAHECTLQNYFSFAMNGFPPTPHPKVT